MYNTSPIDGNLPYRKREAYFRRFEAAIAAIVVEFPKAVTIRPTGMSVVTYANGLRDAWTSYAANHWPTDKIDQSKFDAAEHYGKDVCHTNDGLIQVRFGLSNRRTLVSPLAELVVNPNDKSAIQFAEPTCLADLQKLVAINLPVFLRTNKFNSAIEQVADVVVVEHKDTSGKYWEVK